MELCVLVMSTLSSWMVVALQWFLFLNCHHINFGSSFMIVDALDRELRCCVLEGNPNLIQLDQNLVAYLTVL